jgi:hypothetical protein
MFNAASRLQCRRVLDDDAAQGRSEADLVPIFDMLYFHDNIVWYQSPDGEWNSFAHKEGFTQGCPLSVIFACKVLHPVLKQLKEALDARAQSRLLAGNSGDDGEGSRTPMGNYLDDCSLVLPFEDIAFVLDFWEREGPSRGLCMNRDKNKILYTLDPTSAPDTPTLRHALSYFKPSAQLTDGTTVLGTPIGSPTFIHQYLMDAADTFEERSHSLQTQLDDFQTKVSLFQRCLQPSALHLLAADVLLRSISASHPIDPYAWSSPFVQRLNNTTASFLAHISGHSASHFAPGTHPWFLAHLPIQLGGLGFTDLSARAVASFAVPMVRSIRYALQGIRPQCSNTNTVLRLDPSFVSVFSEWSHSTLPSLTALCALVPPLLATQRYRNVDNVLDHLVGHLDLCTLSRDLIRSFKQRQLTSFLSDAPPDIRPHLPMILNRHTSEGLLCMSRRCHDQRLPSPYFRLMFCRKLRLPVYSGALSTCSCSKPIDEFGDHFFSCQRFHPKTAAHNAIRDALHLILSEIGIHAGIISSRSAIHREPLNLAQCHPTSRPGDLVLDCAPTYVTPPALPFSKVAVDVRVTSSLPSPSGGDQNNTVTVTHHHQKAEREKFCGPTVNTESTFVNGEMVIRALNESNTVLLPFVVDPFGQLGPIANAFLFGLRSKPPPPALSFSSPTSQTAYDNATSKSAPFALTVRADRSWSRTAQRLPFGRTYHSWFPTNWARQVLGATINSVFAKHLYTSIRRRPASVNRRPLTRVDPYPLAIGRFSRITPAAYYEPTQNHGRRTAPVCPLPAC